MIGVMIPSVFAQTPAEVSQQMTKIQMLEQQAYVQQQNDRQYQQLVQAEEFFEFVKYTILIIVATVSAILIIVGITKSRKKGTPTFCQNCRTVLKPTSKFCSKCGTAKP